MMTLLSEEEWANRLMVSLYEEKYIQTPWNTMDPDKRMNGWILKNGLWMVWSFNIRPSSVDDSSKVLYNICQALANMMQKNEEIDLFIAVEMAGISLLTSLANVLSSRGHYRRFGYSRSLPENVRTPLEALQYLQETDVGIHKHRGFIEARVMNGDNVAIFDSMAADLDSNLIARLQTLWEAKRKGINVSCDKIFCFLNGSEDNHFKGKDFVNNSEKELYPAELLVEYIIDFNEYLHVLEEVMCQEEYEVITAFQKDPQHFQDKAVQKEVLEMAAKTR